MVAKMILTWQAILAMDSGAVAEYAYRLQHQLARAQADLTAAKTREATLMRNLSLAMDKLSITGEG
jgi:hypothetical protein